jgi:hypothetical protein
LGPHVSANLNHFLIEPEAYKIDMMRSQVQKRSATALTPLFPLRRVVRRGGENGTRPDQLAKPLSLQIPANLLVDRIEAVVKTNHRYSPGPTPCVEQFAAVLESDCERFFQIEMLAALQRSDASFGMESVRQADNRSVNIRALEHFVVIRKSGGARNDPLCCLSALRIRFAQRYNFRVPQAAKRVEVDDASYVSATDETYSQNRHGTRSIFHFLLCIAISMSAG